MIKVQPARINILAGFSLLLIALVGCGTDSPAYFHATGSTMGTTYSIKISQSLSDADAQAMEQAIQSELQDVNAKLSTYQTDSELSRFNQSRSIEWHRVSGTLYEVVEAAQTISEQTGGAFDVTVGPLVNLWGFGPEFKPDVVPADSDIQTALLRVGYHYLTLNDGPGQIKKSHPDLYVDLSAIAKGYGVDRVAALIEAKGFLDYMVEIGGEVRCKGRNPSGSYWQIAIEKPLVGERTVQRIVPLADIAIATSGDYRNFFELDGVRYSHALNPVTGWPVRHDLTSVTVLAESSMLSDGWATAFMVLGAEKGYDLALQKNLAVLFVRSTQEGFREQATPAFESYLKRTAQ